MISERFDTIEDLEETRNVDIDRRLVAFQIGSPRTSTSNVVLCMRLPEGESEPWSRN